MLAAADQETGERFFDQERIGSERARRPIARDFVAPDPVPAGMTALRIAAAAADGVPLDRLAGKGVAGLVPATQGAQLEVQIQRPASACGRTVGLLPGRTDAGLWSCFIAGG